MTETTVNPVWRRWWLALCLLVGLLWGGLARAEEFLAPEQAFRLSAQPKDERSVELHFEIAPGYYLYRERLQFTPAAGAVLAELALPAGKVKFDENFQKNVETYHDSLNLVLPVAQASGAFTLSVSYQGCADAGLCYPPQTAQFQVSLRAFGGDGSVQPQAAAAAALGAGVFGTGPGGRASTGSAMNLPGAAPLAGAVAAPAADSGSAVESGLRQGVARARFFAGLRLLAGDGADLCRLGRGCWPGR
jgi:thiol:disulfide interchange protein DsbD